MAFNQPYVSQPGDKNQSKQTGTSVYGQPPNTASYGSSSATYSNSNAYGNPATSTAGGASSYSSNSNSYVNPSTSSTPSFGSSSVYGNNTSNIETTISASGYASRLPSSTNNNDVYGALPSTTSLTSTYATMNNSTSSSNNNVYGQLPSSSTSPPAAASIYSSQQTIRATTSMPSPSAPSSALPAFSQALDLPQPKQPPLATTTATNTQSSSLSYSSNNNHHEEIPIEHQPQMVHTQPTKTGLYQGNGPTSGLISEGNPVRCHKIDFEIKGYEMQLVEIELDPTETVIGEAGAMMFMEDGIKFESKFGDGSEPKTGFFKKLMAAGGRLMTGESLFLTHFTNECQKKSRVAFAAPYPGSIVPINLANQPGQAITCQRDAFLCAALGTKLSMTFNKRIGSGLFGGEGFILEKLEGDGMAFLHAGGTIIKRELNNERIRLDTGCLVAFTTQGINFEIMMVPGLKSMFFGGEGLFLAVLQGTGTVWMQSLPLSRMADRIVQAAPSAGGNRVGEGSRLTGGVGDLIGGGGLGGFGGIF